MKSILSSLAALCVGLIVLCGLSVVGDLVESMAKRAVAGSKPDHRGLVAVPVATPRRAAS